ncbi:DUF5132 domain-containing protein [Calothrix sp. UHCC 0171]|uniref:DUF5132 domain-containing protein n=1 Tax=Calothrix sp. UHCC 0171 TaxID=3110245 RepID=UPI002B20652C|nr:DUF5132 domain-containing protein [Calothrix sp. UHCC 0171]MEA5572684.1 DUF5132 domain-containing protein [Calothrix sp. UHCC 0171]
MTLKFLPDFKDLAEDFGLPGIAAIVLLPVLIPLATGVGKPIAKVAIKGGILLAQKGKAVIAEVGENFEDIIAEAKAELAEAKTHQLEPTRP